MRMKALSEPDSSQTAMLIAKPSCFALAVAAERMTCAVSALMLRFSKLVIPGFLLFVAWQKLMLALQAAISDPWARGRKPTISAAISSAVTSSSTAVIGR